jgi:hypothetical protein
MPNATTTQPTLLPQIAARLGVVGLAVELVPPSQQIPFDLLRVAIPAENEKEPPWLVEMAFTPIAEEELKTSSLLQCFVELRFAVRSGNEARLCAEMLRVNATLPLVGFGFFEQARLPYYRHVLLLPKNVPDASIALAEESVWMIGYLLERFVPQLAHAAA